MKIKFIQKNRKGQSLVEVIVACGIIGIILAAMMNMVLASKNLLAISEDKTKATALAQQGIEIARHQRDIGCSFSNITNPDGSLKPGPFIIKGDTNETDDETIQNTGVPGNILNASGFSRYIIIEELTSNTSGIGNTVGTDGFTDTSLCSDPNQNYDCASKYYAVRVDIHKGDGSGPIISQARTIISR